MDSKVNYSLVGFFVFGFLALLVAFLLWLAKFGFEQKAVEHYTIVVADSVSGLNIESPVKFRGVEVGRVSHIAISANNSETIEVKIEVEPNTPIKQDSVAILTAQGITGLSYIELKGGSKDSAKLKPGGEIKSGKSLFAKLENSADNISQSLVHSLSRVDALLSEQNITAVHVLLSQLSELSSSLNTFVQEGLPLVVNPKNAEYLHQTLANTAKVSDHINQNLARLPKFLSDKNAQQLAKLLQSSANTAKRIEVQSGRLSQLISQTISLEKNAEASLQGFKTLSTTLNSKVEKGEYDLRQMTEHHLEAFSSLLVELQMLTNQTNEVLQRLKRSPSDLFFKQEGLQRGPGE